MTRRALSLFVVLAALGAAGLAADLPSAWRSWLYSRSIESPRPDFLNYLTLDREAYAHSENHLADLRVIDDLGNEQPYGVRNQLAPPPKSITLPATVRENSFVPGQFTQVLVDLGTRADFHSSLRVQTPESDFINWVEVAASDDAHLWRIVKPRAPISRFRKDNLDGSQTITYSENNARYLRLRIEEPSQQFPVTGVEVFASPGTEKKASGADAVPLTPMRPPDSTGVASLTEWTVDLGTAAIPVAELNFETTQSEFYRAVRVLTSPDEKEWRAAGGGEIYRFAAGGKMEESLRVRCYEPWGLRYWRIEILNANDTPLQSVQMSLAMNLRFVLFHPKNSRTYRLLYGNARAVAPHYDLARTLRLQPNEAMAHLGLGPEESTANYADPRPFTERHPNLLWMALALAIVLLGYAAQRALRTPTSDAS
jgi:hypothetical protein